LILGGRREQFTLKTSLEKTWAEKLKEAEALERILRPEAKERQAHGQTAPGKTLCPNLDEASIDTKKEVSKAINTSHGTLYKVKTIAREKPELIKDIDSGKKSVNSAYQIVKREERLEKFHKQEIPLPEGKFNVIYHPNVIEVLKSHKVATFFNSNSRK